MALLRTALAASAASLALAGPARAQEAAAQEAGPWSLEEAAAAPDWLTLSGSFRTRYESLGGQFRHGLAGSDQLISLRTTLFAEKERAQITLQSIGDAVISADASRCGSPSPPGAATLTAPCCERPAFSIDCASRLYVKYVPDVWLALSMETPGNACQMPTSRSGLPYGSGRNRTPLTTAKIATEAPIPMTRVRTALIVKAGVRRSERQARRNEWEPDMVVWWCCRTYGGHVALVSFARRCRRAISSSPISFQHSPGQRP